VKQAEPLVPYTYAYVKAPAPTYRSPEEALNGGAPRRVFPAGYVWVSVHGRVEAGGKVFYLINPDEYIDAAYLAFGAPSAFPGCGVQRAALAPLRLDRAGDAAFHSARPGP
jgi:hypothetical protein